MGWDGDTNHRTRREQITEIAPKKFSLFTQNRGFGGSVNDDTCKKREMRKFEVTECLPALSISRAGIISFNNGERLLF